jgi:ATP-dependent DNA ligase I
VERFARAADAIAARSGKLEKVAVLAGYLRELGDADLVAATRFFTGRAFAARDSRTLSIGGRSIVNVARGLWSFGDAALSQAYRSTGDLGSALARLVRSPAAPMLLTEPPLTPGRLDDLFGEIGDAAGKNAAKRRESVLERILRACREPAVVAYVVKIVTGDLRLGLREGLVLDAIAAAFAAEPAAVRRAVMASGDVGAAALAARDGRLDDVRVEYGTPIGFMLASPIAYGDVYADLTGGGWMLEDKYDGIRAQAHVRDGTVRLFSRRLNEVSASYPDVAGALAVLPRAAILDGEIVAMRDGRVLPFRHLQARLRRKRLDAALLEEVPLAYVAFDLLALGDDLLLDEPYARRRALLADLVVAEKGLALAPFDPAEDAGAAVNARFEQARARGNEGLMLKRADSPYSPGRRGKWWLKLKRELSTLDVVVIAVEWGHGKRAKVLSDYTFAVRESAHSPRLLAIGKAYSGLTDGEIESLTGWFLAHALPAGQRRTKARSHEIPVEPEIVLEVAFDIVARSDLHESGFALRFPRIVRIRDDKPVAEIDTLDRVAEIYAAMLVREGVST